MTVMRFVRGMAAAGALTGAACHSLDIENPNAPDNKKVLSDPVAVEAVGAGSLRVWTNAWLTNRGAGPLTTMSRSFSASWNNDHMRFYSSVDNPGNPATTGYNPTAQWFRNNEGYWANDPARPERVEIESFWTFHSDECCTDGTWPGVYAAMSAANDALGAIRGPAKLVITDAVTTKRLETIAMLGRGLALMTIALNYDKGYIIDENTDLASVQYSNRKLVRDAAIAAFQAVVDTAAKYTFTTDASWMNGRAYTNDQIKRLASTLIALTYAYYPRDNAETTGGAAQVTWTTVATFAAAGMSSGTPFDFVAVGDGCVTWCPDHLSWFDDIGGGRVNTRVAYLLDPNTQNDPWPLTGNLQPNSVDKRLGDGSFGLGTLTGGRATPVKTANAGTDFTWAPKVIMRPDRGAYHQSNIAMIRYDLTGNHGSDGINNARGPFPTITATLNDLIWAEALLRQNTAALAAQAATLINKTRVNRGGLTAASAADGIGADTDGPCTSLGTLSKNAATPCTLFAKLLYEKEIELLGIGPSPYYEQRRLPFIATCGSAPCNGRHVAGLLPGTPREMPVPAKELQLQGQALYTFGGLGAAKSTPP